MISARNVRPQQASFIQGHTSSGYTAGSRNNSTVNNGTYSRLLSERTIEQLLAIWTPYGRHKVAIWFSNNTTEKKGSGDALAESTPFVRRVMGSTPAIAAT